MKTAEEILEENELTDSSDTVYVHKNEVIRAMEEYASQFKPKWISVKDRLPKINYAVMVHLKNNTIFKMVFDGSEWFIPSRIPTMASVNNPVTHWMSLSDLPQPLKED